jgi:hypothetical protein
MPASSPVALRATGLEPGWSDGLVATLLGLRLVQSDEGAEDEVNGDAEAAEAGADIRPYLDLEMQTLASAVFCSHPKPYALSPRPLVLTPIPCPPNTQPQAQKHSLLIL